MIQSTNGMSRPRAATSVQSKIASLAFTNWKNVCVLLFCFCLPWEKHKHTHLNFIYDKCIHNIIDKVKRQLERLC